MSYFDKEITCSTCGMTAPRFDKFMQTMWASGDKYSGTPIRRGHIVISKDSCFFHAVAEANERLNTSISRPY